MEFFWNDEFFSECLDLEDACYIEENEDDVFSYSELPDD